MAYDLHLFAPTVATSFGDEMEQRIQSAYERGLLFIKVAYDLHLQGPPPLVMKWSKESDQHTKDAQRLAPTAATADI